MLDYNVRYLKDMLDQKYYKDIVIKLIWSEWEHDHRAYGWKSINYLYELWSYLYHEHTLVAIETHTNALLGFCSITTNDLGIARTDGLFLANLYVLPSYRNQGIAKTLISHTISSVPKLYLWTYTDELVNWYKNVFGFIIPNYLTNDCVTVMVYGRKIS